VRLLLLFWVLAAVSTGAQPTPGTYTAKEIAGYRLTAPVFQRFDRASRLLATAIDRDAPLAGNSPFTRDVVLLEDVVVAASTLDNRLRTEPALAAALKTAGITVREYTTFTLALVAARLAYGFVQSGAMRFVPEGVARENVTFVEGHRDEVMAVLRVLGIDDP